MLFNLRLRAYNAAVAEAFENQRRSWEEGSSGSDRDSFAEDPGWPLLNYGEGVSVKRWADEKVEEKRGGEMWESRGPGGSVLKELGAEFVFSKKCGGIVRRDSVSMR